MKRWYLFSGILAAVLGLLVIIFPSFWIKLVVVMIGLAAVGYGIYCLKFTKVLSEDTGYRRTILIKGIVSIVAGAMAVLFPLAIGGAAWTAMIWVLIIYLMISATVFPLVSAIYAAGVQVALESKKPVNMYNWFMITARADDKIILTPSASIKQGLKDDAKR